MPSKKTSTSEPTENETTEYVTRTVRQDGSSAGDLAHPTQADAERYRDSLYASGTISKYDDVTITPRTTKTQVSDGHASAPKTKPAAPDHNTSTLTDSPHNPDLATPDSPLANFGERGSDYGDPHADLVTVHESSRVTSN